MKIAFLNPQGNFDSEDKRWGSHPDFGGQLVYVKEVARSMAHMGEEIDIITRRIKDNEWTEFSKQIDFYHDIDGVRILRIDCGPSTFLRKELLWPHLNEWTDNIVKFYDESNEKLPDFFVTNYGDGGLAGVLLFKKTGIPFSFTGHSLGAQKLDKLLSFQKFDKLDEYYHFSSRITAERLSIKYASVIFTSTSQEKEEQYTHNLYNDIVNQEKIKVVPPGVNIKIFNKSEQDVDRLIEERYDEIFVENPERFNLPPVICSSRLDPKKNHKAMVEAFAKSREINESYNLIIVTKGMKDPRKYSMEYDTVEANVLKEIFEIAKRCDIGESLYFININNQLELASLYRIGAKNKGIFALTTYYEPFGLAPLEAAACGLPVLVTKNGGPSESLLSKEFSYENGEKITKFHEYGCLVDPMDIDTVVVGLKGLLDTKQYNYFSDAGYSRVMSKYTWDNTSKNYLKYIKEFINKSSKKEISLPDYFIDGKEEIKINYEL